MTDINPDVDIDIDLDHPADAVGDQSDMPGGFDAPLITIPVSKIWDWITKKKENSL